MTLSLRNSALLVAFIAAGISCSAATFKADTTACEKRYSKQQLVNDVNYLTQTIANVHPNMYHSISAARYAKLKDSVTNALTDSMTAVQAWPIIAPLVGALNEGHSSLFLTQDVITKIKSGEKILFPISIRDFDGQSFNVRADLSDQPILQAEDKIVSINGFSASTLVDMLSKFTGGMKSWRALDVCRDFPVYTYLFGIKAPYRITYLRGNKKGSATISPIGYAEFASRRKASQASTPAPAKRSFAFQRIDGNIGYMEVNDLGQKQEVFKRFLDSVFTSVKQQPVSKLIIDLRRNGGGNSALAYDLLTFITTKPFRMTGGVQLKISQEFKDAFRKLNSPQAIEGMKGVLSKENGSFISSDPEPPNAPQSNPLLYNGPVCVLIGPNTFSSANMLANTIQDYKLATLIGSATGEHPNDYGDVLYFYLPNTQIPFGTSSKRFIRANGDAKDNNPVLPNHTVVDNPLTVADEVLEFAKRLK